jgi:hypothetical protein
MHLAGVMALLSLLAAPAASGSRPAPAPAPAAAGKVFLTQEEALRLAFPDCAIERRTVYLDEEDRKRAEELAGKGVDVDRRVVYAYVARRAEKVVGTAYFDAHRVRTLDEVLMFVIDAEAHIVRLELLNFGEPEEYIPRGKWYAQFHGKGLSDDLRLKGDIKGVSGATLTATATADAARRTLALHTVLAAKDRRAAPGPR